MIHPRCFRNMGSKSHYSTLLALLIISIPVVVQSYYLSSLAINVPMSDDWELVPLIQAYVEGGDWIHMIFSWHGEFRIVLASLVSLGNVVLTKWNIKYQVFLIPLLQLLATGTFFWIFRKQNPSTHSLVFLPVPILLFNTYQLIDFIGIRFMLYLSSLLSLLSMYFISVTKGVDKNFVFSTACGIAATLSHLNGLLVWPIGLTYLLLVRRKVDRRVLVLWPLLSVLGVGFYSYDRPAVDSLLTLPLSDPIGLVSFVLSNLGSSFGMVTGYSCPSMDPLGQSLSLCFGILLVSIFSISFFMAHKKKGLDNPLILFALFSLLSSGMTTIGRLRFGIEYAFLCRYASFTSILIVSTYLVLVKLLKMKRSKCLLFFGCILVCLIAFSAVFGNVRAWNEGQRFHIALETSRKCLTNYRNTPDEYLRLLHPDVSRILEYSPILETHGLSSFSEAVDESAEPKELKKSNRSLFWVNWARIDSQLIINPSGEIVVSKSQLKNMTLAGWAVDPLQRKLAEEVYLVIGENSVRCTYGLEREDIVSYFNATDYRYSGWVVSLRCLNLPMGEYTVKIRVLGHERRYYTEDETVLRIIVIGDP